MPASYKLVEPTNAKDPKAKPTTPEQARLALVVAEKALAIAEAELPAIRARFTAERTKRMPTVCARVRGEGRSREAGRRC